MHITVLPLIPIMYGGVCMAQNKFTKSIAFNKQNPIDIAIIEFTKKKNFSGYVKKLILSEMKNQGFEIPSKKSVVKKEPEVSRLERLKLQLASAQHINQRTDNNTNS